MSKNRLFLTKPLPQLFSESKESGGLKRSLTALNLTTLGIGAIIGAGIFVLTGQAAAQYAGPGIVLSFIISGFACGFAGLCYAEFASMIPIAGSAYTYSYATLGEFLAWIIGWDLILEYLFAASTVAVGWSGYVVSFLKDLNIFIPPQFTGAVGSVLVNVPDMGWKPLTAAFAQTLAASGIQVDSLAHVTCVLNLPAMFIVALLTTLLVIGIRESANFNNIMVITKVSVIILFIAIGFMFVKSVNWHPFIPANKVEAAPISQYGSFWGWMKAYSHEFGKFGISGVLRGAGVIFFAYIGFDAVSTAAQEAKNPQRDMPIGILGSLGISTVLYILVAIVLTGIVSYTTLNVADPVAVGVDAMGKGDVLAETYCQDCCYCRIKFCYSCYASGSAKDLLLNVKRWLVASCIFKGSSKVQNSLYKYYHYRNCCNDYCRDTSYKYSGRIGFNRHSSCFYNCLYQCSGS